eukprot:710388-Rhodomonas_salina.2
MIGLAASDVKQRQLEADGIIIMMVTVDLAAVRRSCPPRIPATRRRGGPGDGGRGVSGSDGGPTVTES